MRRSIDSLPIRFKILGSTVSVLLVVVLFSLLYYPRRLQESMVSSVRRGATAEAEMVALGVGIGLGPIDDDPTVRTLARLLLEKNGFRVAEVGDGPAAVSSRASRLHCDEREVENGTTTNLIRTKL